VWKRPYVHLCRWKSIYGKSCDGRRLLKWHIVVIQNSTCIYLQQVKSCVQFSRQICSSSCSHFGA
jgi:hypothetical protein